MTSTTRTIRRTAILAVAVGIVAMATAACAPPPAPKEVVEPAKTIDTSNGLVVNGEQIADKQLWDAAVAEGSINLYTGYTENTEAALLKQFTSRHRPARSTSFASPPTGCSSGSPPNTAPANSRPTWSGPRTPGSPAR